MSILSYKRILMGQNDNDKVLDSLSKLFKLLSDANRLRIIFALGKDRKSVSEIMNETSLPQTLVSFHLRPLRESGLVSAERQGPFIFYRVSDAVLIDLLISLAGVSPLGESHDKIKFIFPPMQFMQRWMK
jgi:DNA-binding transcriptional ArsR family regulator